MKDWFAENTNPEGITGGMEEAIKGDDNEAIEAKIQALSEASAGLAQKMYAEQAEAAQAADGTDGASAQADSDGDTVDAEFEEIDDKDAK